ncbi:hypothetical protein [Streptomyces sp. MMG1121]|nr:hypothetical protein [Streptomyces sp. MMG1121]
MIVVALLVPVMVMLFVFALDAYEDLLFPTSEESGTSQETPETVEEPGP